MFHSDVSLEFTVTSQKELQLPSSDPYAGLLVLQVSWGGHAEVCPGFQEQGT